MGNKHLVLLAIALCIPTASAFGVSSPYWEGFPLKMHPGQSQIVSINLQNCPSRAPTCDLGSVTVLAEVIEGSNLVTIQNPENTVGYGTANTDLLLAVTIPEDEQIGAIRTVAIALQSAPTDEEAALQLGVRYIVDFPIEIVTEDESVEVPQPVSPAQEVIGGTWMIITVLLILIIAVVWTVILKRKK